MKKNINKNSRNRVMKQRDYKKERNLDFEIKLKS